MLLSEESNGGRFFMMIRIGKLPGMFQHRFMGNKQSCFAWASIPDHVQLFLRTGLTLIATAMQWLNNTVRILYIGQPPLSFYFTSF